MFVIDIQSEPPIQTQHHGGTSPKNLKANITYGGSSVTMGILTGTQTEKLIIDGWSCDEENFKGLKTSGMVDMSLDTEFVQRRIGVAASNFFFTYNLVFAFTSQDFVTKNELKDLKNNLKYQLTTATTILAIVIAVLSLKL